MSDSSAQGPTTQPVIDVLAEVNDAPVTAGQVVATVRITLPPGSSGTPPHRHPGPAFGYVVRGAVLFEVEGQAPRTLSAGEAFWEPGGDVIHYQDANALSDQEAEFVVTLLLAPGQPLLTLVEDEELAQRAHLRVAAG